MVRTSNQKAADKRTVCKKLHLATGDEAKKGVLIGLCQRIQEAVHASDSDHIPYGIVQEIINNDLKETFSWISRDKLSNVIRAQRVHQSKESKSTINH